MNSSNIICNPDVVTASYREALENTESDVVARWAKYGLLDGIAEGEKVLLATYYEVAAQVMLRQMNTLSNEFGHFETEAFPLIRVCFVHNIITPTNFGFMLNKMYNNYFELAEAFKTVSGLDYMWTYNENRERLAHEFLTPEAYQLYLYER